MPKPVLLIDNYDSFTFNLAHLIGEAGGEVRVVRNDAVAARDAAGPDWRAVVISPGPCTPSDAGVCLDVVQAAEATGAPLFGVCLGMQSFAQALGGEVRRARRPMHGKVSSVCWSENPVFHSIPRRFTAARYHSLSVEEVGLPGSLQVLARADDDREIMALAHVDRPLFGVQFHPESIASEHGAALMRDFLEIADGAVRA